MNKTCTKCGETKPATTEFFRWRKRRNKSMFYSWCIKCEREANNQYDAKNQDKRRAYRQKRLAANTDYRELKNKPTEKRTKSEKKELAFLRRNRTSIEAILERETKPSATKRSTKELLKLGHTIPNLLGMNELERADFNKNITGKTSMKDMTSAQKEQVVIALTSRAKEAGIDTGGPESSPLKDMVLKLEERKQKPALTRRDRRNMSKLRRTLHTMKSGTSAYFLHASRLRRLSRALDNYEDDGPFMRNVYQPVKDADTAANVNFTAVMETAVESFKDIGIDAPAMLVEVKDVGIKDKLSTAERIGVYALAQNKNTMKHLLSEFTEDEIAIIVKSVELSTEEVLVADHIKAYFEQGYPTFQAIAAAAGVKSDMVKKSYSLSLLIRMTWTTLI